MTDSRHRVDPKSRVRSRGSLASPLWAARCILGRRTARTAAPPVTYARRVLTSTPRSGRTWYRGSWAAYLRRGPVTSLGKRNKMLKFNVFLARTGNVYFTFYAKMYLSDILLYWNLDIIWNQTNQLCMYFTLSDVLMWDFRFAEMSHIPQFSMIALKVTSESWFHEIKSPAVEFTCTAFVIFLKSLAMRSFCLCLLVLYLCVYSYQYI